jgi:tRNA(Ile)-lysidine synthase
MLERLREKISIDCGLLPGMEVVVGISGGPDSLTLLDIFYRLGHAPLVAHLNHQLRPEADEEASKVREAARRYGLAFVEERADARQFAQDQGLSVEEAGRALRYRFLFEHAARFNAGAVAVAHTADDQVETVVMHMLRGAGLSGLKGMQPRTLPNAWSREIPLVRPLLDTWRSEVLSYCAERGLEPVFDPSNLDSIFYRNRLRNELIPYLERFNPGVKVAFWRMAKVLQADFEVIERLVEETWEESVVETGPGYVVLLPGVLRAAPAGVQMHLFRRAIAGLRPGLRDVGFETIERAVDFLMAAVSPAQVDLSAGLRLVIERMPATAHDPGREWLWLAEWQAELPRGDWPQVGEESRVPLSIPGSVQLPGGWVMEAQEIQNLEEALQQARANTDPYQAWISLDRVPGPLELRARSLGDRFQPLGLGGHSVKLSDFMIDQKLPNRARHNWPLLLAGDEIAWVPGFRLGHLYRLTSDTRRAGYLSLHQARSDVQSR